MENSNKNHVIQDDFKFDLDGTTFKIFKMEAETQICIWHTDQNLLKTGYGAIDHEKMMINGNMNIYPQQESHNSGNGVSNLSLIHNESERQVSMAGSLCVGGDDKIFAITFKV